MAKLRRGYKVMAYDPVRRRIVSGANSRLGFPLRRGSIVTMPGAGIYLSLDPDYVVTYYTLADEGENVLLTFAFDPKTLINGNLTDRETEFSVPTAKLLDYRIY